jgi:hypothetical protein
MPRCDTHVSSGFRSHQCARNGVVERDGKFYCKQHDPVAVRQRDADRSAAWDAQWAAKEAQRKEAARIAALQIDAVAALREIAAGHNDPKALAVEVLAKHVEANHAE